MGRIIIFVGSALWLAAAPPSSATKVNRTVEVQCPGTVTVDEKATAVPAGWKAHRDAAASQFESVSFFDGPMDEHASLAPDSEPEVKGNFTLHWTLPASARGYSVACGYSRTSVELVQPLAPDLRSCEVTYNASNMVSSLPVIVRIACK